MNFVGSSDAFEFFIFKKKFTNQLITFGSNNSIVSKFYSFYSDAKSMSMHILDYPF